MPNYVIGLDLGKQRDYSAAVVTERVQVIVSPQAVPDAAYEVDERLVVDTYHVRHIQRWPLGTPYGAVVDDVADLMRTPEFRRRAVLLFDATGVGGAVGDMFSKAHRADRMGDYRPRSVTLTGGFSRDLPADDRSERGTAVHKGDLVSRLVALFESERIKLPLGLPLADALEKELRAFTLKQTKAGALTFEAKRESDHDDLVIALALSVWYRHRHDEPRYLSPNDELLEKPWAVATNWSPHG